MGAKGISTSTIKGKAIGVTGSGGVTEFATVEALTRNGLIRDRDYKLMYSGTSPVRVKALETGIIQAAPFSATEPGSDIGILRRSLSFTVDTYSISLTKRNIEALLYAAKINVPASGTEKFFTDEFLLKALGR